MSKGFLRRLTEAHSWLGLCISGVLFVVFFAGSISLFRDEIKQWAQQPHFPLSETVTDDKKKLPVSKVIDIAKGGVEHIDPEGRINVNSPKKHLPYFDVSVELLEDEDRARRVNFLVDPYSGAKFETHDDFELSDFIYELHTELNIPTGTYIVGFVTLFLFFAVVSGIFIHARKLVTNFFKYRHDNQTRSKLLDIHNVIGVMSIPFTLMYAMSGLIFNLIIIYQIAFAVVLYKGDQDALLHDAGVQVVNPKWQDKPLERHELDVLFAKTSEQYGQDPYLTQVFNYSDDSAVVRFFVREKNSLTIINDISYNLKDSSVNTQYDAEHGNALREGLSVFSRLHFADFAGVDIRILYFILGMAVCGLIVTGNLLWIKKREKQRGQSARTLDFVKCFTVWSAGGVVLATSVAFFVERVLPISLLNRADYMASSFVVTLALSAVVLCFKFHKITLLSWFLRASGGLCVVTVACGWVMFSDENLILWSQGITDVFAVDIGLLLSATLLVFMGNKLIDTTSETNNLNVAKVLVS